MLTSRPLHSICLSCRLRLLAAARRHPTESVSPSQFTRNKARRGGPTAQRFYTNYVHRRKFSAVSRKRDGAPPTASTSDNAATDAIPPYVPRAAGDMEAIVRKARQAFGDALPEDHLTVQEMSVYERLYGPPVRIVGIGERGVADGESKDELALEDDLDTSPMLFRKGKDGEFEEVEFYQERAGKDEQGLEELGQYRSEMQAGFQRSHRFFDGSQSEVKTFDGSELDEIEPAEDFEEPEDDTVRAHPLTAAGRFATSPSTLQLPKGSFVEPISTLLADSSNKHLSEVAQRVLGGIGLPYSPSTPRIGQSLQQKPIALDASQSQMAEMEGDVYMAAVMPGTYAAVMSTIVEVRKRLGSTWLEGLLNKEGGPRILDAGAGGAGVVAWHEVLRAEWMRMHEESGKVSHGSVPLGKATVLTGSNALRHRASRFLENTTFIPRLPDYVHTSNQTGSQPRKFYDVIIAPHILWPLREEYMRKQQVQNLWSLLNPNGGVLILIEKGLPRGFEVVAAARALLLDQHIASPQSTEFEARLEDSSQTTRFVQKEPGMIVAPCTNHVACPMYVTPGVSKGRKDFCYFTQRYIRPPYLQRILGAKDRNHEDVQFSYVAVQRGRDQRRSEHDILGDGGLMQGDSALSEAFAGYEHVGQSSDDAAIALDAPPAEASAASSVNTLSLPRTILPPLKRRGHVLLDLCTPAGTLERWTVPRSFSRQAYRDARKAKWGDLWALGAKTRTARGVRLGRPNEEAGRKKGKNVFEVGVDREGRVIEGDIRLMSAGGGGREGRGKKGRSKGKRRRLMERGELLEDV